MQKDILEKNMVLLQQGNEEAFDIIYEEMHKGVYMLILSVLKDTYLAEDIMQNTFVKVRTNISQYKAGTNAVAWILTIAKSLAINEYNRKKREIPTDMTAPENVRLGGASTMDSLLDKEVLAKALSTLNERERSIVLMHVVGGLKHREIAEHLGITLSNTLWIYHNSIKKLKIAMENEDCE